MSEKIEQKLEKKEKMSEKKESGSSDQTDHVSKDSILKEFLNKLKNVQLDNKTCDNDDDLTEKFEEQLHLKEDANKGSQALLRNAYLKNVCTHNQTKASSSASSDSTTDPEASKKDIASSIEAKSEEDMNSDIIKYLEILKKIDNTRYFKKYSELIKEKEIETEEPKEEVCSKDGSTDTQTKAFSSPESDLEFSKMKKKLEKEYLIFKINKCMQKFLEAFVENMKSEKVTERQKDVERLFEEYDNLEK